MFWFLFLVALSTVSSQPENFRVLVGVNNGEDQSCFVGYRLAGKYLNLSLAIIDDKYDEGEALVQSFTFSQSAPDAVAPLILGLLLFRSLRPLLHPYSAIFRFRTFVFNVCHRMRCLTFLQQQLFC